MPEVSAYQLVRELRGVRTPCQVCVGTGVQLYQSGATWRGGAGGAVLTYDVCSRCWGTGDRDRVGVDLRDLTERLRKAEWFLGRVVKYVREDGAKTPGFTRLARAVEKIALWLEHTGGGHG